MVDTTKGYWHVQLDHESSLLCTFNTPFGGYRFKCLPFGIVVSLDIFQRQLHDIYKIPNVTGTAREYKIRIPKWPYNVLFIIQILMKCPDLKQLLLLILEMMKKWSVTNL